MGRLALLRHDSPAAVLETCFGLRSAPEGDGWIIVPVSRWAKRRGEYLKFDTCDISDGPICRIEIPFLMGWTPHGHWMDFADMPESMNITAAPSTDSLRPTIEAFYNALFSKDAELLGRIVDEHFDPDAFLHRPESLPGGGRTDGASGIKRFMIGATKMAGGPLDVADMSIVTIVEGDGAVAVELAFPFAGQAAGALELWTIENLKVQSIRAFYWDTAGMLKAAR